MTTAAPDSTVTPTASWRHALTPLLLFLAGLLLSSQLALSLSQAPDLFTPNWLTAAIWFCGGLLSLLLAGLLLHHIRARLQAEAGLQHAQQRQLQQECRWQAALACVDEWLLLLDDKDRILAHHAPAGRPLWPELDAGLGQPLQTVVPALQAVALQEGLSQARQQGQAELEFDIESRGEKRRLQALLRQRSGPDGEDDGITLCLRDITLQRTQARALSEAEGKFRLLFEESTQPILLSRSDRHVDANPAALSLLGVPNLAALQHAGLGVISPTQQPDGRASREALAHYMQLTTNAGPQRFEWTFQRLSDGQTFPAQVQANALNINGRTHFLSTLTDLTSHKQAEASLIEARDAAESAMREKNEFLATMSHEIRTPMNGVLGMAQMLANTPLNDEQQSYLHTIIQSGQGLLTIINDILDFSKIEAGKLSFEEIPFDLQIALNETCDLLLPQIREKKLSLQIRVEAGTPLQVIGDPGRFRQILLNYLNNAFKFTQQGSIKVLLRAREAGRGAALFELAVADTGIGISADKQELLFRRFSQLEAGHQRRFGGAGLGLAICKALVEHMGGEVSMSSSPGQGSTFRATFWLSLDPNSGQQLLPVLHPGLRHARVLVLEQQASAREACVRGLEKAGLSTVSCGNLSEAHKLIQEAAPRFLVLDAELAVPELAPIVSALRALPGMQECNIILLTTQPGLHDHAFCRAHGIVAYLPKPARIAWILGALNLLASGEHEGVISRQILAGHHARGRALPSLRKGVRVLLAEDNAVNQKVAARMLEKMGCHVDMAGNGLEALALVAQLPYDLILMDVQMPEMDGITATRQLRAQGYTEIPIVALTANNRDSDRQECRAVGMSDFLAKPIRYEELHSCLSKWL